MFNFRLFWDISVIEIAGRTGATEHAAADNPHPPMIYPIVFGMAFSTILAIIWVIDVWQP